MVSYKDYTDEDKLWLKLIYEPIERAERKKSNSIQSYEYAIEFEDVLPDNNRYFHKCRLLELGGKRLEVLYQSDCNFALAAQRLNTKEITLRQFVSRLGIHLTKTGVDRKQVTTMLQKPCVVELTGE